MICFAVFVFNINKWWNSTKITILYWFAIVDMRMFSLLLSLLLLLRSSCVFSALVVSIHHLWFRFILIYVPQPGKIFISDSLSQWTTWGPTYRRLSLSTALVRRSAIFHFIRPLLLSLSRPCLVASCRLGARMLRPVHHTGFSSFAS